jgi:Zn finger protein HypA/HybF involved in hydrogenase expression
MHDHVAVTALIDHLTRGSVPAEGIAEVRVRAGASYSREALEQAYEMLVQDTPLEGSRLVVEPTRDEHACAACGNRWLVTPEDVAGHVLLCPSCGVPSAIEHGAQLELVDVAVRGGPSALPC